MFQPCVSVTVRSTNLKLLALPIDSLSMYNEGKQTSYDLQKTMIMSVVSDIQPVIPHDARCSTPSYKLKLKLFERRL